MDQLPTGRESKASRERCGVAVNKDGRVRPEVERLADALGYAGPAARLSSKSNVFLGRPRVVEDDGSATACISTKSV